MAVDNARLYETGRMRQEQLDAIRKVGQEVSVELEPEPLLHRIVRRAAELIGAGSEVVYTLEDQVLVPRAWWNLGPWMSGVRFSLGEGIPGTVARDGEAMIVNDYLSSPYVHPLFRERSSITAAVGLPLISKGRLVGVITINNAGSNRRFSEADAAILSLFAPQAASAIDNVRLYDENRRRREEVEKKNQELEAFVYTVTHDLRAPLVAIQGMASMLLETEKARLDDEGRHYLDRLIKNTAQMEELIRDLLEFSRVGRLVRPPEPVAVGEMVDDLLLLWAEPIRAKGVKVSCHDLPMLWEERTRIEQVFSNLLGNAIKFLGAENPAPAIEVGAEDRGTEWECYVQDNGIGIDPAYHGKVFGIFQRLGEVEAEGTGVGLAIVKKIVELAGGRVWVESAKGRGATFRFTWPKVSGQGEGEPSWVS